MVRTNILLTLCALVILALGAWWFYGEYVRVGAVAHDEERERVAAYVTAQAAPYMVSGAFLSTNEELRTSAFESFFRAIQSPELFRVKIWTKDFSILWSDLPELIGKKYADNAEVAKAYTGTVVLTIGQPKLEHVSERQVVQLLEVYVPIRDASGNIVFVIETYAVGEALSKEVAGLLLWKGVAALGIALLLILVASFILRKVVRLP